MWTFEADSEFEAVDLLHLDGKLTHDWIHVRERCKGGTRCDVRVARTVQGRSA